MTLLMKGGCKIATIFIFIYCLRWLYLILQSSIGIRINQQSIIEGAMAEAPHLFWGYQEDVVVNRKSHFILPGDMLVFFSGSIILDEFCLHANKVIDVFGIDHSVVRFDGEEGKLMFMFYGAATCLNEDEVRNLLIKVYQGNERGQWRSAIPDNENPWEG